MKQISIITLTLLTIATFRGMAQEQTAPSARVPAYPYLMTHEQPNGDTLHFYLRGDERYHYMMTEDSWEIRDNEKGAFCYVKKLRNGQTKISCKQAKDAAKRSRCEQWWLKRHGVSKIAHVPARRLLGDNSTLSEPTNVSRRISQEHAATPKTLAGKRSIKKRGLILLVAFKDTPFSTPKDTIDSMMMGNHFTRNYEYTYSGRSFSVVSEGSARQYFEASSFGQYSPIFEVAGPVTVANTASYYGSSYKVRTKELVVDACKQLRNNKTVDFSQYDEDNDGFVDYVYVIYAGYGSHDNKEYKGKAIWPHAGTISDTATYNGKKLSTYACGSEMNYWSKTYYGIGVFCHEFSHVLGLPDFYNTDAYAHKTLGNWDIMDQGPYVNDANTPPLYSAYERFFMGWMTPRILTEPENVELHDLAATNEALLISPSGTHNLNGETPNPTTFYLLESHRKEGWHAHCPGEGMLISKIRYNSETWASNTVNNVQSTMGVDIIEADGLTPWENEAGWEGKVGDCFPYGATEYTGISDYPITDISFTDGEIRFKFKGGIDTPTDDIQQDQDSRLESKFWHNGHLLIRRGGHIYNLIGQCIQ